MVTRIGILAGLALAIALVLPGGAAAQPVDVVRDVRVTVCLREDSIMPCRRRHENYALSGYPARLEAVVSVRARCEVFDDEIYLIPPQEPVRIELRGRRQTRLIEWTACAPSGQPVGAVYSTRKVAVQRFSEPVGPERTNRYAMRIHWTQEGRTLGGVVRIRRFNYEPASSRIVWSSNFDDYFNVCVREGLPVWAAGGRLYCRESFPAGADVNADVLPLRR